MNSAVQKAIFWVLVVFILLAALFVAFLWPMIGIPLIFVLAILFCLMVLFMPRLWNTVRPRRKQKSSGTGKNGPSGFQPNMMLESCVTGDLQPIIISESIFTIGRGNDNTYVLNQPTIGRHHCKISYHEQTHHYYIEDLGSKNGTFINANRLNRNTPVLLKANSIVGLDQLRFIFKPINTYKQKL